jgi:uncharacterized OsmC-like protein
MLQLVFTYTAVASCNNSHIKIIDIKSQIDLNDLVMRVKEQTIYDPNSEQFKYLKREENTRLYKVDINELNKRLNKTKRSNLYGTILVVVLSLSCLTIISFIGLKF